MGNRLLLADDSITIQKVVAIIFANEEFELTVVDNGIAALEKAREVRPDVMLVDALMPGKSGYEVCAEVRRDPALSSTPILLLIGAFEPFDEEKGRSCGADASITKPFESQQLIDRVKELLAMGKSKLGAPAAAAQAAPAAPAASVAQAAPAAPAAAPLALEAAAEELWGDLSAFDTMPPPNAPAAVAAPAAPAQPAPAPQAPAAPAPQAPAAAVPQAPPAAAPQAPVAAAPQAPPAPAPQPAPVVQQAAPAAPQPAVEVVEVSPEDDLWGAFELEEIPAAQPSAAAEAQPEFEVEEFFSFEEDSEGVAETGPALDLGAPVAEPAFDLGAPVAEAAPAEDDIFSFADVEPEPFTATAAPEPDPFSLPVEEPFSFEPEVTAAAELPIEPVSPVVPAAPVAPPPVQSAPAFQAEAAPVQPAPLAQPAAQPAQASAAPSLSEADLIAALSKVSREVIERIVWEVVPDLAEVLIKEEIRKLRAGVKG